MIASWDEINRRYDAIKDHKPRATKKLKEIGEILASSYQLDPYRADEMWQYIIELNIQDDVTFSKFYIAQVFSKINALLPDGKAVDLLSMRPERVRLMFLYGYEGNNLIGCAYDVIGWMLSSGDVRGAVEVVSALKEKYTIGEDSNTLYVLFGTICALLVAKTRYYVYNFDVHFCIPHNELTEYFSACEDLDDHFIQAISAAHISIIDATAEIDVQKAHSVLYSLSEVASVFSNSSLCDLFLEYLHLQQKVLETEQIESILVDFFNSLDRFIPPQSISYPDPRFKWIYSWFIKTVESSEILTKLCFTKEACDYVPSQILMNRMHERNWKAFLQCLVLGLNQSDENASRSYLSFIKGELSIYQSNRNSPEQTSIVTNNSVVNYHLSDDHPEIDKKNIESLIRTLAKAVLLTSNSVCNKDLVDTLRSFATKETGNVELLNEIGLDVTADNRTEVERFCEYAEMESDRRPLYAIDIPNNTVRDRIKNIELETRTYGMNTGKILSQYPQIISFLFLHEAHLPYVKANLILGALLDNNYSAAVKCIDYLIETAHYPNFSDKNGWAAEMTFILVLTLQTASQRYRFPNEETISQINSFLLQATERCLPFLSDSDVRRVNTELVKIQPAQDQESEFVSKMMENVEMYTAASKPTGYSKRAKSIQNDIFAGLRTLVQIDRIDTVSQILKIIVENKQYITDYNYALWMVLNVFLGCEKKRLELYSLIPEVFAKLVADTSKDNAFSFLKAVGTMGNKSIYRVVKSQILQKHGYIDGMDLCFIHTNATDDPILLIDNSIVSFSFLYWNDYSYYGNSLEVKASFLVKNKTSGRIHVNFNDIAIKSLPASGTDRSSEEKVSERLITVEPNGAVAEEKSVTLLWNSGMSSDGDTGITSEVSFFVQIDKEHWATFQKGTFFKIIKDFASETFHLADEP